MTFVSRNFGLMNKRNPAVIDELVATDFVDHNPMPGIAPGIEGVKQTAAIHSAAFPDLVEIAFHDMIAEGDKVVVRWTVTGTHRGEMLGIPPTGKQVTLTGVDIFRIVDGKLVELWVNSDQLGG
ncbi:MAG: ester cyclase [Planctomycetota bacterium]|nr:ester cyclase [Planctomycetota bacterium]